jgi:hypothetical protein
MQIQVGVKQLRVSLIILMRCQAIRRVVVCANPNLNM